MEYRSKMWICSWACQAIILVFETLFYSLTNHFFSGLLHVVCGITCYGIHKHGKDRFLPLRNLWAWHDLKQNEKLLVKIVIYNLNIGAFMFGWGELQTKIIKKKNLEAI